jgi:hypothetical protein
MDEKTLDRTKRPSTVVLTPGGPRLEEQTHFVGPDEAVRQNADGTFTIVAKEKLDQRERTRQMPEELVLTPGGYRPKSRVHFIEPGHTLQSVGGRIKKLDATGKVVADLEPVDQRPSGLPVMPRNVVRAARAFPAFGSGWISYADWTNNTGNPVSSFSTTWTVPPAPSTSSGQTIFLFSGIQNSNMIYQPVLQWGKSQAGGGAYWAVASWYADGSGGQAHYSSLTRVNVGDNLVGIITLTGQDNNGFSYDCEFQGIANSGFPIQNVEELIWCVETLEAYGITQATDYPGGDMTALRAIALQTDTNPVTNPVLAWTPVDSVTDRGQHTIVVSNANPGGEVDIHYGALPAVSDPFGYSATVPRVVYRASDGHIHEFSINQATGQWQQFDMNVAAGAPAPAGDPRGYLGVVARVVYRGQDSHIHEIALGVPGWQHFDMTAATGAPLAMGEPFGYFATVPRVVYRASDSHIHEFSINQATGQWQQFDMNAAT